jgi:putative DNA primase/helicase
VPVLTALDPAPQVKCQPVDLVATEAGRTQSGVLATVQVVNGSVRAARTIQLTNPADRMAFAREAAAATDCDEAALETAVLQLLPAVEAALRRAKRRGAGLGQPPAETNRVPRRIPPPSEPMGVARALVADLYRAPTGDLTLRHWRTDFHRYDDGVWGDAEASGIREAAYRWLEDAVYLKDMEPVPWAPTARKVSDVIDALSAIVHLDRATETPSWIDDSLAAVPARGTVVMENGLLHVPTRQLVPHSPAFWSHHGLPYPYDDRAEQPARWVRFLKELWPDDPSSISTLQELFGYAVAGDTRQQKIFLLVGPRRSGKGTIARVLTGVLGRHNVAAPTLAGLATNFGLQELITRPLAIIADARLSSRSDASVVVERLLSISGEDSLTIDRKYRDPWTGRLPTRFVILTNELPKLADSSGALAGRFVLLVLQRSFYGKENPALTAQLLDEAPAILNWSLEGLDRLLERGYFEMPASSADVIRQMEDLASPVGAFVRTRCVTGQEHEERTDALWKAWRDWAADQNIAPGSKAMFGRDLKAAVSAIHHTRPRAGSAKGREYVYQGIRLARDDDNGPVHGPPGPVGDELGWEDLDEENEIRQSMGWEDR